MSQQKKHPPLNTSVIFFLLVVISLDLTGMSLLWSADESRIEAPTDINFAASSDTISMSFDGVFLKDVLLLFSQQAGLNFIASQEVESKKVTVYFENVTPKDALDSIMTANGLSYSKKPGSDIFIVYPASKGKAAALVTRVIRLKYMRLSSSPLDIGGQVTVADLKKSSASSATSTSSSSSSSGDSGSKRGADMIVEKLLSPQGKVTMDLTTNSLIITDTEESIASIERVLAEVDVPPSQVILEVHIMEVSKNLLSNIGIEWGGANGALGTLSGGQRTVQFPFKQVTGKGNLRLNPLAANGLFGGAEGEISAPTQISFGTINASDFAATLHFIQTDTTTKILARPRVLTQNNEAASIKLITNSAIGENTNTNAATGAETTQAERSETGVSMRMTPQINADDSVSLFLEPSVSTVLPSILVNGRSDPTTRLVRTMARVKNDQTLVIGGLIDGQVTFGKKKVPFLGDLPLVGKAFRYDTTNDNDRELIVFVTPHIVRGATSLGNPSATARGEDVAVRRLLDQFMDREMNALSGSFQGFETTKKNFFTQDESLVRDAEQRYSNPVVEKQMSQALDSLSPQVVDRKISQTLDSMNPKK